MLLPVSMHTCVDVVKKIFPSPSHVILMALLVGWAVYLSKNGGHHDFQIDLEIELMIIGIELELDLNGKGERLDWMQQVDWVPYDCGVCYFCINSTPGMTPNVAPPKKGASSYVSRYGAVRDIIGLPHIDLIGSTSQIHSLNCRTKRYFPTRHTFVS